MPETKEKTSKITKGTWTLSEIRSSVDGCLTGEYSISAKGTPKIAVVHSRDTSKNETKANAAVIAAAKDLLEACKYAFENLSPKGDIKKDFSGHNAMATLSKAIHKAETIPPHWSDAPEVKK
jgi:hypothetical protein